MDQQTDKQLDSWKETDKRNSTAFMIKLVAVPIASMGQKNSLKPSQSLNLKITYQKSSQDIVKRT